MSLSGKRQDAIQARAASGVERRWIEALDAYHGRDSAAGGMTAVSAAMGERLPANSKQPTRSTVYVQLTRQKTNAAAARLADMLYPTDDKNWGIKPTPVPELMDVIVTGRNEDYIDQQTQGPLPHPTEERNISVADVAAEAMAAANKKAKAMELEIDDQLTECQYNYEGRKVIMDAAILGTGILKGPVVVNRVAKKWQKQGEGRDSVQILEIIEKKTPASVRVDPWNFFPDSTCADDVQQGSGTWEREYHAPRQLRDLAKVPGYLKNQIIECLREGPQHYTAQGGISIRDRSAEALAYDDARYELWTYVGDVDRDDLESVGVTLPGDELDSYSAIVVMCNNRVIKAIINPMDTGGFPYDVFIWERFDYSPWGVGIPYLMQYAQRTLNAAWRALLDNMAITAGGQIVMDRTVIIPADGKWEITRNKIWWAVSDSGNTDITKAFSTFEFASHQAEFENVIRLAMQFADEETSLPQIAQGNQGTAPHQVGSMTMLMNSANTVLRRLVKQFDDTITRRHIRRYYDWNMQYNPKEEIKGDFECDARGSTALMVRDQQNQALAGLMSMGASPVYGIYLDPEKVAKLVVQAGNFSPDDVMRTASEIEQLKQSQQQQQQPPAPQIEVAKIRAETEIAKTDKQLAAKAQEVQMTLQANAQESDADRQLQQWEKQAEAQLEAAALTAEERRALNDAKVTLSGIAMKLRVQRELSPGPQVIAPPNEPAGRANNGMAYQQ
jgi:hypothetical protein